MEFRLLGAFEVWDGGGPVEIAGQKRRALLALLVLRANEVVRSERLVDELWGERPPRNAGAALRNHVSRLRKALGAETIASREWGYVLRAAPEDIDLRRFEGLVAEAEPLAALDRSRKLAEALELWRGPPLADLVNEPALQRDIDRLEELRLSTLERRIEADLELGQNVNLVGELESLVAEQPLREHLRWLLILALYRAGRQAEALEVYRETRRLLTEELGLEPSPALKELEQAILRQDPSLDATASSTQAEPPETPPETRRRRTPAAILALLALGLAGTATAIALVRPEKGTSSATATEAIFQTLTATSTESATATHPATAQRKTTLTNHQTAVATPRTTSNGGPASTKQTRPAKTPSSPQLTTRPRKRPNQVSTTPFKASYDAGATGATHWDCSGARTVNSNTNTVKDSEWCVLSGDTSSLVAGTYSGDPSGSVPWSVHTVKWASDYDGTIATQWTMSLVDDGDGTWSLYAVVHY